MANVAMPHLTAAYTKGAIRGGVQSGTSPLNDVTSAGVVLVNNPAVPVFVPYGQTVKRGRDNRNS